MLDVVVVPLPGAAVVETGAEVVEAAALVDVFATADDVVVGTVMGSRDATSTGTALVEGEGAVAATRDVVVASRSGDAGESMTCPATLPTAASATAVATIVASTHSRITERRRIMATACHHATAAELTEG